MKRFFHSVKSFILKTLRDVIGVIPWIGPIADEVTNTHPRERTKYAIRRIIFFLYSAREILASLTNHLILNFEALRKIKELITLIVSPITKLAKNPEIWETVDLFIVAGAFSPVLGGLENFEAAVKTILNTLKSICTLEAIDNIDDKIFDKYYTFLSSGIIPILIPFIFDSNSTKRVIKCAWKEINIAIDNAIEMIKYLFFSNTRDNF